MARNFARLRERIMAGFTLTLVLEHYDRHLPLLEGKVVPEGFAVHVEHVTVEEGRHERMLHHRVWDACELSLSSYLMAKARSAPLTAVPVFPRRLFSQSQMYINTGAGIAAPRDLIGRRVGLRSFQTTLSVLAKGDLQHEYGVPLDQVTWVTSADDPVPFAPPPGVCIERAPRDQQIETMLVDGAIQAYMVPRMPRTFVQGSPQVARLFQDPHAVERVYYQRNGFYPIMHVLAVKPEVLDAHPEVAMCLFDAFERAKEMAWPSTTRTTPIGAIWPGRSICCKRNARSWALIRGPMAWPATARISSVSSNTHGTRG
jgi:4,5-dihydroxyphthalate decarboxylase